MAWAASYLRANVFAQQSFPKIRPAGGVAWHAQATAGKIVPAASEAAGELPFQRTGGIGLVDAIRSKEPKKPIESRATSSVVPVLPDVRPPNSPPFAYCCAISNAEPVPG